MLRSVGVDDGSLLTFGPPTGGMGVTGAEPPAPPEGDGDCSLLAKLVGVAFKLPCLLRGTDSWFTLGSISTLRWVEVLPKGGLSPLELDSPSAP